MSVEVIIEGNIGQIELKTFKQDTDQEKNLLSISVGSTDRRKVINDNGQASYEDDPTAWHQIEYWSPRAKHLSTLLSKGMAICIHGQQKQSTFFNEKLGADQIKTVTLASRIFIVPTGRIEAIQLVPKKTQTDNEKA